MTRLLPASAGSSPYLREAPSRRRRWLGPFGLLLAVVAVLALSATIGGAPRRFHLRSQMTVEEFDRSGLQKLSAGELAALEGWLNGKPVTAPWPPLTRLAPAPQPEDPAPSDDPLVAFNTRSRKFHCPSCQHAKQCTRNCVEIRRSAALERGGVPCGVCGGCLP